MHLEILDPNVSTTMNAFIIIGNIITLCQNVPQVIKTYKVKSTKDFSSIFLLMRVTACIIWGAYSIEIESLMMLINNLITLSATGFISYYKIKEIINDYKLKQYNEYMKLSQPNANVQNDIFKDDEPLDIKVEL